MNLILKVSNTFNNAYFEFSENSNKKENFQKIQNMHYRNENSTEKVCIPNTLLSENACFVN
jgi:hypothetical protein